MRNAFHSSVMTSMVLAWTVYGQTSTIAATPKYQSEEIAFVNEVSSITLKGTLAKANVEGPSPAVVLISGSGPHDRDEEMMGYKPFRVLADYLARHGISVLRFDDRGTNGSTGDFAASTVLDFATDVEAAIQYVQARKEIDGSRIGLIGHSEGGLVASIVGARDPSIRFIVLLAALAAPGKTTALYQNPSNSRGARSAFARMLDTLCSSDNVQSIWSTLVNETRLALPSATDSERQANLRAITSAPVRTVVCTDPGTYLKRLQMPVLGIYGSLDRQVPPDLNVQPMRDALKHNPAAHVEVIPGVNHLFQRAKTGSVDEYEHLSKTIAPRVLTRVGDWITSVVF